MIRFSAIAVFCGFLWTVATVAQPPERGHRWHPVDLTGSWYVAGMRSDLPPALIRIQPDAPPGEGLFLTNEQETSGPGRFDAGRRTVSATWNGRTVSARFSRSTLDWGESQWKRVRILGCYFDDETGTLHEVITGERGFLYLRSGLGAQPPVGGRPIPVRLLAEDVFEAAGRKAMLIEDRLGRTRLTWNDGRIWSSQVWLQGQWQFGDKHCFIRQDGRQLQFQNESGDVSNGTIDGANLVTAEGWKLSGTLTPDRKSIRWMNATGDVWERCTLPQ